MAGIVQRHAALYPGQSYFALQVSVLNMAKNAAELRNCILTTPCVGEIYCLLNRGFLGCGLLISRTRRSYCREDVKS